ncbi:MAG: orotidine-5'-phosphate decarboxylase [Gemmatimonadota bacterium]
MKPEVIVAIDVPEATAAVALVDSLPADAWIKIGLELFAREGPAIVGRFVDEGRNVFLDLKLHDIPNTVAGAVRNVASLGARLLTVHASGGESMLRAAAQAAGEASAGTLKLLAVTVLTSLDDAEMAAVMGPGAEVEAAVGRLAGLARESGIDGVISSVAECRAIKLSCGEDFLVATPGIRLANMGADDQKRVATPSVAAQAGADFIVVGRAITGADHPAEALRKVRAELVAA